MVNHARRAAEQVVSGISDQAAAHLHLALLPVLKELVEDGGASAHPAVLCTVVNDYCGDIDIAPAGKVMIRSAALAWIETQTSHDASMVEAVALRIVENAIRSNTLASLQSKDIHAKRKAVRSYVGYLESARRQWDKTMKSDTKRFEALMETLPMPPPSEQAIARILELFAERGLA